jgi:hypothetical protein
VQIDWLLPAVDSLWVPPLGGESAFESLDRLAADVAARVRDAGSGQLQSARVSIRDGISAAATIATEAYNAALDWKDNSEFSKWLTEHLSDQQSTITSKAMDAEYLRTHIGGGWHRLYDGGHTLGGSWTAIADACPDFSSLDLLGTWANEYWKDLITTRGMPIILLDQADGASEFLKHLDSINVAQLIGGELCGVSIYCNWNDPDKLVASATAIECSGIVYANVVAPLVSLIALGRAYFLLRTSEQAELQSLIAPALKGLSRSGASVLLISIIPGGFLIHLSSGIVISLAHNYAWAKGTENKELIFETLKNCLLKSGIGRSPVAIDSEQLVGLAREA